MKKTLHLTQKIVLTDCRGLCKHREEVWQDISLLLFLDMWVGRTGIVSLINGIKLWPT